MPKLRYNLRARVVHLATDFSPASERFFAAEVRYIWIVRGGRVSDPSSLRHDQPDAAFGATSIIIGHVRPRYSSGGKRPRHRCHDEPVPQLQRPKSNRIE